MPTIDPMLRRRLPRFCEQGEIDRAPMPFAVLEEGCHRQILNRTNTCIEKTFACEDKGKFHAMCSRAAASGATYDAAIVFSRVPNLGRNVTLSKVVQAPPICPSAGHNFWHAYAAASGNRAFNLGKAKSRNARSFNGKRRPPAWTRLTGEGSGSKSSSATASSHLSIAFTA